MKNVQKCESCKETNLFMDLVKDLGNNTELVVRVRYDFDCEDRNEFDIQIVEYINTNEQPENSMNYDWTYSFNTNYCPICRKQMENQRDDKYLEKDGSFNLMIRKTYRWVLRYDNKEHEITVLLGINKSDKNIQLKLYIDNVESATAYRKINYDPVDGKEL